MGCTGFYIHYTQHRRLLDSHGREATVDDYQRIRRVALGGRSSRCGCPHPNLHLRELFAIACANHWISDRLSSLGVDL